MNKAIGYAIVGIGLVLFALTFPGIRTATGLSLPAFITNSILTIISLAVLAIGIFIVVKTSSPVQPEEVPIYEGQGKNQRIVGYRKTGKK